MESTTSTTHRVARPKVIAGDSDHPTAVTEARPFTMFRTVWKQLLSAFGLNNQSAESTTSQVLWWNALISKLRVPVRPSAIWRFVMAGRVDAVKRQALTAAPHVGQEGFIRRAPAVTYGDPSATVVPVIRRRLGIATRKHASIRTVFPCVLTALAIAVLVVTGGGMFALDAATALRMTDSQVVRADDSFCAAIASATPKDSGAGYIPHTASQRDDREPSDPFPNTIACNRHVSDFTTEIHPCES